MNIYDKKLYQEAAVETGHHIIITKTTAIFMFTSEDNTDQSYMCYKTLE
jgi:hypothetical protein